MRYAKSTYIHFQRRVYLICPKCGPEGDISIATISLKKQEPKLLFLECDNCELQVTAKTWKELIRKYSRVIRDMADLPIKPWGETSVDREVNRP